MTENEFLFVLYLGIQIVAVLFALRAVKTARTPQGSVGWVVFLFAAPHIAVPIYLFLGHKRYPGYIAARREMHREIASLRALAAEHAPRRAGATAEEMGGRVAAFERLSGVPVSSGNAVRLLIDGQEAFAALFDAIDAAQNYVLMQFYTIADDALGRRMAEHLIARAKAGVRVLVLYDALGSNGLPRRYLERLRSGGVDIRNFHAIRHARNRLQVNFRNHRKIVVVDGEVAFTGGMNLADAYLGRDPDYGAWRDTMVRVEGPVVAQLQFIFAEDWRWSSGDRLDLDWAPRTAHEDINALVVAPGPADELETGALYFVNAIGAARRRIWIASPYFVPDIDILTALKLAALRGVEVRVLVPEVRDNWLVWLAAFAHFDEVRHAGVEIWRYRDGFMHQKVLLVDDDIASVGSVNLDNRSCRLNFEVTMMVFDAGFIAKVEAMLTRDFAQAVRLTVDLPEQPSFLLRNAAPMARLFAPIL
jgi:cardiolipin synthase A/B